MLTTLTLPPALPVDSSMGVTTQPFQREQKDPQPLRLISSFTDIKKMPDAVCIVGSLFGSAEAQQDCGSCYLINMQSVVAIMASDIILTVFITISVFCFVTHHKRRREWDSRDGRRNVPSSVSRKMPTEVTESPYQELHGVQSDVYSELRHFTNRK